MRIELPSGTPAELIRPSTEPSLGVVIAPDIIGLRPLFVDLCAFLAEQQSWAVAAVEPFPGRSLDGVDERFAAVKTLDDDRVLGDLVAAGTRPNARTSGSSGSAWAGCTRSRPRASSHFDEWSRSTG